MKKLFRYTFYRIAKRIIRFFVAFSLIVSICFGSIFYQYEKVEAAPAGALAVVGAIGSILGIANVTSGGSVTGMFAEQKDKIEQWWSDYTGNGGIYIDSNDNYVFSGEATNALYESLDADFSTDAKVVSNFNEMSLNVPASFFVDLNNWKAEKNLNWSDILEFRSVFSSTSSGITRTYYNCWYFDISNVACLYGYLNQNGYSASYMFRDSELHAVYPDCCYASIQSSSSDYSNYQFNSFTGRTSLDIQEGIPSNKINCCVSSDTLRNNGYFINFPFVHNSMGSAYCSRSLILGKNAVALNSLLNKDQGVFITNNYYGSQIPSISKNVFEENNWDSVYNSYINNINNNSENWLVDGEVDVQALRDEMAKQSNIITDAIVEGNTDIAGKIDYTNEWLKKIYNLLIEIKTLVANNQGGGGSSSTDLSGIEDQLDLVNTNFSELISKLDGVSSDLEDVLQALYSIESFSQAIDTDLDQLQQQYLVLSNIYSYMQSHPWGSGGGGGPFITPSDDPWEPWFRYIDDDNQDFPYGAILTKYNIIKTLIQGAAPYCFIAFIGGVLNSLEVEPVMPEFTIPVKSNGSIFQVDEELHFDLSGFEILLPYIHAMFIILFTVGLMWFSFPFIRNLIQIFDL